MSDPRLNRRGFLRRGGAAAFAAGAAGFVAGDAAADESTANTQVAKSDGETFLEPARQIPIVGRWDVIVCGAGPAGIAAAVRAGRDGARVLLIESNGCLGGIWTAGLLGCLLDGNNKPGITQEVFARLDKRDARRYGRLFEPEPMKIILDEMVQEAKVDVLLHSRVVAAHVDQNKRLKLIVTESKSGREAFAADVFIDATGDGDLSIHAGCGWDYGCPDTGEAQPFSYIILLSGIQLDEIRPYASGLPGEDWSTPKKALAELIVKTTGHGPSYASPTLFPVRDDVFVLMANHEYGLKGYRTDDLTTGTFRGRAEVNRMIDGLRSLGGPWSNIRIVATPEHIGVRASRRIHGRYTISNEDIASGARFKDSVCRCTFGVDVHSTNPDKSKSIDNRGVRSKPYDIPFRSMLPSDVDGLMTAGRCISGDFFPHSSYRVTGNSVATGEAAGTAAVLAAKKGVMPHELAWKEIEDALGRPIVQ